MSQVDKLNYIPLLIWFVILMGLLYIIIFLLFIPLVYTILKTRIFFFEKIIAESKRSGFLYNIFFFFLLNLVAPINLAINKLAVTDLAAENKYIFSKK